MIVKKRGKWLFQDKEGKVHKFKTEAEAQLAFGPPVVVQEEPVISWPVETEDAEDDYEEEEII